MRRLACSRSVVPVRRLLAAVGACCVFAAGAPAQASHRINHYPPAKAAKVRFAAGFPHLVDHEWNFAIGGFGGIKPGAPIKHAPIIFVHGNNVDHGDWYPVRDDFRAAGWTDQELWSLSYNGLGSTNGSGSRSNPEATNERIEMGWDGLARVANNDYNVPDLYDFIRAVRAYTGSTKFSLVTHSLGVTLARKTLKVHPELRSDLVAFVGIAGGNHGTSLCPPGSEDVEFACDEVAADTPWLADLNGPNGSDETYPPAKWLTIYDGTGAGDIAYVGPKYAESPVLKGADNRKFPLTSHNNLRLSQEIVAIYRTFIETSEQSGQLKPAKTTTTVLGAQRTRSLPATGVETPAVAAIASLSLAGLGAGYLAVLRRRKV